ncbi:MAG: PEP-CTERM sorting domain-containing protein [Gemmata sp.]|jgi:MYXO-CTERM domain-containing protein
MWAAVAVLLAAATEARAFYWYGWPGSQLRVQETLVTPPGPAATVIPQPIGPPVPIDNLPLGPPEHTPEPATGLLALFGVGAVAARRWAKRK